MLLNSMMYFKYNELSYEKMQSIMKARYCFAAKRSSIILLNIARNQ